MRYLGDPKFTLWGAAPPWMPPSENTFYTRDEYFVISDCVFNFNFLALAVSEILGGPKFT